MSRRNDSPGVTGTLWAAAQEKGRPPEPPSQKASLPDRSSHRAATARPDPGLVFILSFYGTWHLLMRIKGSGHLLSVAEGQGHLITRAVSDPVRLAERATEKVRDEPLGHEPRSGAALGTAGSGHTASVLCLRVHGLRFFLQWT